MCGLGENAPPMTLEFVFVRAARNIHAGGPYDRPITFPRLSIVAHPSRPVAATRVGRRRPASIGTSVGQDSNDEWSGNNSEPDDNDPCAHH